MSSINGVHYKVETIGSNSSPDPAAGKAQSPEVDDFFEESPLDGSKAQGTDATSPSALDDYNILGSSGTEGVADSPIDEFFLKSPPTLAELIAAKPELINYLSVAYKKYEKYISDVTKFINEGIDAPLASGTLTAAESKALTHTRTLAVESLAKAKQQLEEISRQTDQKQANWILEMKQGISLDGDPWVGQPFAEGSYQIVTKADGTKVWLDYQGNAIPPPLMDPEYTPNFGSSDAVEIISEADAFGSPEDKADLYLRLKESALNGSTNELQTAYDLGIPEYLYVKKGDDGEASETYVDGHYTLDTYKEFDSNGQIAQKIPENLSQYMQVKVAKAVLRNTQSPVGSLSGNPAAKLYNTVLELRDKDNKIIMTIRVDGCEGSGPGATMLDSGVSYNAASTFTPWIHGSDRISPIIFDASAYISTGRTVINSSALGDMSATGDEQATRALNENLDQFTQKELVSTTWDPKEQKWVEEKKDFNSGEYAYGEYNTRYIGPDDLPPEGSPYKTYATGFVLTDIRGHIKGTNANDIIKLAAVDEFSQYAQDHMAKGADEIAFDQPMYDNFVETQNGNDFVIFGKGNNYIRGASAVWGSGCGTDDKNYIVLRNQPPTTGGTGLNSKMPNIKNFVHIEGGSSWIVNPNENDGSNAAKAGLDANTEKEILDKDPGMHDDWYEVMGTAYYGNPGDYDVTHCPLANPGGDGEPFGAEAGGFIDQMWTDAKKAWDEEFKKVPDLDAELEGTEFQTDGWQNEDIDAFFNEYMPEFDGVSGEISEADMGADPVDESMI